MRKGGNKMIFWSIIFAICLIGEVIIPALVSIWFAIAAAIVLVLSIFIKDPIMQAVIFVLLSLVFLLLLRNYCKKFLSIKDKLPDEEVTILRLVEEDAGGNFKYDIKYKGATWTAISKKRFNDNDKAQIKGFDGNKIKL